MLKATGPVILKPSLPTADSVPSFGGACLNMALMVPSMS